MEKILYCETWKPHQNILYCETEGVHLSPVPGFGSTISVSIILDK